MSTERCYLIDAKHTLTCAIDPLFRSFRIELYENRAEANPPSLDKNRKPMHRIPIQECEAFEGEQESSMYRLNYARTEATERYMGFTQTKTESEPCRCKASETRRIS